MFVSFTYCLDPNQRVGADILVIKQDLPQYNELLEGFRDRIEKLRTGFSLKVANLGEDGLTLPGNGGNEHAYQLILSLGTQSTKAANRHFLNAVPILFAMVLNPADLGLNDEGGGGVVGGIMARIAPETYLEQSLKIQPGLKKIGVLYTGVTFGGYVEELADAAKTRGISIVAEEVESKDELIPKFKAVVGKQIDLFFILPDFRIYDGQAIKLVLLTTFKEGVPCIGPSFPFVKAGALWGMTPSPYHIGGQAAETVLEVIRKKNTFFDYTRTAKLGINMNTARKLEINIPQELVEEAKANRMLVD